MNQKGATLTEIVILLMMVSLVVLAIGGVMARNLNPRMEQIEIKRVTEVTRGDSSQYLVFTKSGDVYQNEDAWFYGKFNSSDLQADFDPDDCFKVKVTGFRVQFLSWYPNIIETYPCEK